jgi:DNA replication protein DnaC
MAAPLPDVGRKVLALLADTSVDELAQTNEECIMIPKPLLGLHLRTLHLSAVLANYRRLLAEHVEPLPYLSDLISLEATKRHENGVRARIAAARFPTMTTIESFDFKLQPKLPKAKLLEHFDGTFVEARRNLELDPIRRDGFGKELHSK